MTQGDVTQPDHGLRRELGVSSLVLTQILYIVGASWIGVAATVGPAHGALWFAAVALFFLPLAMLVAHLTRLMPLEGGVYRWATAAFGSALGYFVAWNLWCFTVAVLTVIGIGGAGGMSSLAGVATTAMRWLVRRSRRSANGVACAPCSSRACAARPARISAR